MVPVQREECEHPSVEGMGAVFGVGEECTDFTSISGPIWGEPRLRSSGVCGGCTEQPLSACEVG